MEVSVSRTYDHIHDKNGEIHIEHGNMEAIDEESPVQQRFDKACIKFRENNMDLFDETQLTNNNTAIPKFGSIGKWKLDASSDPPTKNLRADADEDFDPTNLIQDAPTTEILNIDGEEHWKDEHKSQEYNEKVMEAIDKYKRVFIQGHAGCGKSYYAKMYLKRHIATKKHLVLNYCGSLLDDMWKTMNVDGKNIELNAKTIDKALGQIYDDSGGMKTKGSGTNFKEIDIVIIDEAYMISINNLSKLRQRIDENPALVVIWLGCPYQNELIIEHNPNSKAIKSVGERQKEIFSRIAPYRIVLKVNKRSPQDQSKLETLWKMLFEENEPCSKVIDFALKNKWVNEMTSYNHIAMEGVDTHICYFQAKPLKLSAFIHTDMYGQNSTAHEIWTGEYFLKQNLLMRNIGTRCKLRFGLRKEEKVLVVEFSNQVITMTYQQALQTTKLTKERIPDLEMYKATMFQEVGVYLLRGHANGLLRNSLVKMIKADYKKKDYRFLPLEKNEKNFTPVKVSKPSFDIYRLPYCRTGHTSQGLTFNRPFCIHDAFCRYTSRNWLWTALTRGVSLSNVFIYTGDRREGVQNLKKFVAYKLKFYKEYDAGRGFTNESYNLAGMVRLAEESVGTRCIGVLGRECDNILSLDSGNDALSFDRMVNRQGHGLNNLRCICFECNRRSKDLDEHYRA